MKPFFSILWNNYPHRHSWPRERLFREIGWEELINEPGYRNTCAIRLSVALQKSSFPISSSAGMNGLKGETKGKAIEIRQDSLSRQLRQFWGSPAILPKTDPENAIGEKNGVISFFRIPEYYVGGRLGGHIDLVDGRDFIQIPFLYFFERTVEAPSACGLHCPWFAGEIWFWELT